MRWCMDLILREFTGYMTLRCSLAFFSRFLFWVFFFVSRAILGAGGRVLGLFGGCDGRSRYGS
jgi:hypothetical protein